MKKIILLVLFGSLTFTGFTQNVNLSNTKYWNGECYLAVNPKNPNHLVTAWLYFSLTNLKNAVATRSSFDGGKTWSPLQIQPHVYSSFTSADPTMYFGKDSCIYLAYIDLSGLKSADSGYIMVTRSVNGGITWKAPVKAISYKDQPNLPIDRPWIAADGNNGPYAGRVYLTSQNAYFAPQPHYPWFTYSSDSGATWTPIKRLDDSIPSGTVTDATAFTTVSANGTFYAAYISYYTKYSVYPRLVVIKSHDGGQSFTPHIAYTYKLADAIPSADSLLKDGFCIASNPADTSNLVIIAPSNHFGEPDIVSYNTHDAGITWNGPVRLNDDLIGAYDTAHDQTWGSFTPDGIFGAVWRDRRNTGTGDTVGFQIYGTISKDEGDSYSPNFRLSDTISPAITIIHGNDFLGCGISDSSIYAAWSDMRTGKENTFFDAFSLKNLITSVSSTTSQSINVEVYPNPFHNQTNVIIHSVKPLYNSNLMVYVMDGRQVAESPIGQGTMHTLTFNTLAAGIYTWSLVQNGKILANGKWVVQ